MLRIETLRHGSLLAAFALVLGACSFFSDFPDVVEQGAGGDPSGSSSSSGTETPQSSGSTGDASSQSSTSTSPDASSSAGAQGGGGAGGTSSSSVSSGSGTACLPREGSGGAGCPECEHCWQGECGCPDGSTQWALEGAESTPAIDGAPTSAVVRDIVYFDEGMSRFIGHARYRFEPVVIDLPNDGPLDAGPSSGMGYVFDQEGDLIVAARGCTDEAPAADEVFFFAATGAVRDDEPNTLVVAGAFEAGTLVFYDADNTTNCPHDDGEDAIETSEPNGNQARPFLAWLSPGGDLLEELHPSVSSQGMLVDVADLRDQPDGTVVAVGIGTGDVFGTGVVDGDALDDTLYVVSSNGSATSPLLSLGLVPCDGFATYSAARENAIAVAGDGYVWVAGSGCLEAGPAKRSYLSRIAMNGADPVSKEQRIIQSDGGSIAIMKLAVSSDLVVVAGQYRGQPELEGPDGQAPSSEDPPDEGDAFVAAFPIDEWEGDYAWFAQIRANGRAIEIKDLSIDDFGTIFVAGRYESDLEVGNLDVCLEGPVLGAKGFFMQLDPTDGAPAWVRTEGFDDGASGSESFSAEATAIEPAGDFIYTATAHHGEMLLQCGELPVGQGGSSKPTTTIRRLVANASRE